MAVSNQDAGPKKRRLAEKLGGNVGIEKKNNLAVRSIRSREDHLGLALGGTVQSIENSVLVAGWRSGAPRA